MQGNRKAAELPRQILKKQKGVIHCDNTKIRATVEETAEIRRCRGDKRRKYGVYRV